MTDIQTSTRWIESTLQELSKLSDNSASTIMNTCGKNCCEASVLYQNALTIRESYSSETSADVILQAFKAKYPDTDALPKEGNRITLVFSECTCPLVKNGVTNPFICNCTTAFSKHFFETLLGKKVEVTLEESILRGDSQCKQYITICE